jgi:hypothetical protein
MDEQSLRPSSQTKSDEPNHQDPDLQDLQREDAIEEAREVQAEQRERDRAESQAQTSADLWNRPLAKPIDWRRPIPGEKSPRRVDWDSFERSQTADEATPTADEPKTFGELLVCFRSLLAEYNQCVAENESLRRQLARNLGLGLQFSEDELETTVREAQLEIAKTLRELMPRAASAAKRGKPALLRLISRTIKGL